MLIIFNILVILGVLLIAYWWGNQGLFSSLLHLLCVIVAGALAFAFWEPLTVKLLLRGGKFDNYAWGISLIGFFTITLFILRLATNKLIPANVNFPHWADLTFGGALGFCSGVISIGILVIGAGFLQSRNEILGFAGVQRDRNGVIGEQNQMGWGLIEVHKWTVDFYSMLSATSLSTSTPMRKYYPDLDAQSASLVRDSWQKGAGKIALRPDDVTVRGVFQTGQTIGVLIEFKTGAYDYGQMLTVSRSQIVLIGNAAGRSEPSVIHPSGWTQPTSTGIKHFRFDDPSHYITSVPGRDTALALIEFHWTTNDAPRFIRIKTARIGLPRTIEQVDQSTLDAMHFSMNLSVASAPPVADPTAPTLTSQELFLDNGIRPIFVSSNQLPATMNETDKFLTDGEAFFPRERDRPSRALLIKGILEPVGEVVIQLDVSRGSNADIFGSRRVRGVDTDATPYLLDSDGNRYKPIGYILVKSDGVELVLDPENRINTLAELPQLPSSGSQKLRLIYRVTRGIKIVSFRLNDLTVANCNLNSSG